MLRVPEIGRPLANWRITSALRLGDEITQELLFDLVWSRCARSGGTAGVSSGEGEYLRRSLPVSRTREASCLLDLLRVPGGASCHRAAPGGRSPRIGVTLTEDHDSHTSSKNLWLKSTVFREPADGLRSKVAAVGP